MTAIGRYQGRPQFINTSSGWKRILEGELTGQFFSEIHWNWQTIKKKYSRNKGGWYENQHTWKSWMKSRISSSFPIPNLVYWIVDCTGPTQEWLQWLDPILFSLPSFRNGSAFFCSLISFFVSSMDARVGTMSVACARAWVFTYALLGKCLVVSSYCPSVVCSCVLYKCE